MGSAAAELAAPAVAAAAAAPPGDLADRPVGPLANAARSTEFFARVAGIYLGYKAAQAQDLALRALGWDVARLKEEHWAAQHARAAEHMYQLCVDLRGFYLKVRLG